MRNPQLQQFFFVEKFKQLLTELRQLKKQVGY